MRSANGMISFFFSGHTFFSQVSLSCVYDSRKKKDLCMKPKIFLNLLWNWVEKKFWRIKLKIVFSSKHKFFFNFYLLKKGKLEFLLTTFFLLEKKTELFSL